MLNRYRALAGRSLRTEVDRGMNADGGEVREIGPDHVHSCAARRQLCAEEGDEYRPRLRNPSTGDTSSAILDNHNATTGLRQVDIDETAVVGVAGDRPADRCAVAVSRGLRLWIHRQTRDLC